MGSLTGSELLARSLTSQGMDTLFFLMGGPMLETESTCIKLGVRAIDTRHEQAAAMMAHPESGAGAFGLEHRPAHEEEERVHALRGERPREKLRPGQRSHTPPPRAQARSVEDTRKRLDNDARTAEILSTLRLFDRPKQERGGGT